MPRPVRHLQTCLFACVGVRVSVTLCRSDAVEGVVRALRALANRDAFVERYGASKDQEVILFPVSLPNKENKSAESTGNLIAIGGWLLE